MGEMLPRIVRLSFEVWLEFLADTIHGVTIDVWPAWKCGRGKCECLGEDY